MHEETHQGKAMNRETVKYLLIKHDKFGDITPFSSVDSYKSLRRVFGKNLLKMEVAGSSKT
jgi:hypothetical protein